MESGAEWFLRMSDAKSIGFTVRLVEIGCRACAAEPPRLLGKAKFQQPCSQSRRAALYV